MKIPEQYVLDFIDENMTIDGTGDVVWLEPQKRKSGSVSREVGDKVGRVVEIGNNVNNNKYATYSITHNGKKDTLVLGRIAWYLYTREWPTGSVILKDGNPRNFKIDNLYMLQDRSAHIIKSIENKITNLAFKVHYDTDKNLYYTLVGGKELRKNRKKHYFETRADAVAYRINRMKERIEHLREDSIELKDWLRSKGR